MKLYVAYRFTGEDPKELDETLKHICNLLTKAGHNNYCSFFDPDMLNLGNKNVMTKALKEIDKSDCLVVFIKSEDKSEGMLMEIGYALAKKKKIFLLIKQGVKTTFVREIADKIVEFKNLKELGELEVEF